MAIELKEQNQGRVLEVSLSGNVLQEDFEDFATFVKRALERHGKTRLLVLMKDFQNWTPGALRADIVFAAHHFRNLERLAVVGQSNWQHGLAVSCRPFEAAEIRHFDHLALNDANDWIVGT